MTARWGTDMQDTLESIRLATDRAKQARNPCMGVRSPDTLAAHTLAAELAQIGQTFISISVRLRQAGREVSGEAAELRQRKEYE